jgi:hypothetical protein
MRKGILFAVLAAALLIPTSASAGTYFSGTPFAFPESIPDAHTIAVSGQVGSVTGVQANLNGFSANTPAGAQVVLVGPQGQKAILMRDACGGTDVNGLTFNFTDSAAATLPNNCVGQNGPFKPTDNDPGAGSIPSPAPPAPYSTVLSTFNGTAPNGTWTLFTRDLLVGGDAPSLSGGWSLTVDSAAPPVAKKKKCKKKKHRSAESAKKKKCKKKKHRSAESAKKKCKKKKR